LVESLISSGIDITNLFIYIKTKRLYLDAAVLICGFAS